MAKFCWKCKQKLPLFGGTASGLCKACDEAMTKKIMRDMEEEKTAKREGKACCECGKTISLDTSVATGEGSTRLCMICNERKRNEIEKEQERAKQQEEKAAQEWIDVKAGILCAKCCKVTTDLQSLGDSFMICDACREKYSALIYDGVPATEFLLTKLLEVDAGKCSYADAKKSMMKQYIEAQRSKTSPSSAANSEAAIPQYDFTVTFGKDDTVCFDEKAKKWQVRRGIVFGKDSPIYSFSDIVKYEYQDQLEKKGGAMSSFADISFGQSIGGDAGMLAGAFKSLTPPKVEAMCLLITVKTSSGIQIEKVKVVTPAMKMERGTSAYNKNLAEVSRLTTYLDEIIAETKLSASVPNAASAHTAATPVQPQSSPVEEIRKYKALLDDGIISQEEFESKKKQLLGL